MAVNNRKISGTVFNIQRYSVHDGPGIRTVVFLKGCPLKCIWCSNPESHHSYPELACKKQACLGFDQCVRCLEVCTVGAILRDEDNKPEIDRTLCNRCMLCAEFCPSKALIFYGKTMSVEEVLAEVESDSIFYSRSGGGMTLSGGEPMAQPDFALAILAEARTRRIKTAMETSGYCNSDRLLEACKLLDFLLYDIKIIDAEKHKAFTGVSNETILENLKLIHAGMPNLPILVRTPIIPGFNDDEGDVLEILDFIRDMKGVKFEMLPYHRLAKPKCDYLDVEFKMGEKTLDQERMGFLQAMVKNDYPDLIPQVK